MSGPGWITSLSLQFLSLTEYALSARANTHSARGCCHAPINLATTGVPIERRSGVPFECRLTGQPAPASQQQPDLTPEQLAMLQAMRERVAQARQQMAREQMAQAPEVPVAMNREQRRAAEQAAQREA